MKFELNKTSKKQTIVLTIDSLLFALSLSMYFAFAQLNLLVFGIVFTIAAFVHALFKTFCACSQKLKIKKSLLLAKDFVLTVLIAFVFALVGLTTKSFSLEYRNDLVLNILFIVYLVVLICLDISPGVENA